MNSITRRSLCKNASVAAGAAVLAGAAAPAMADVAYVEGVEWPGAPMDASGIEFADTWTCEALVCGLGAGGSVATCRLAQLGVDTIAIEKAPVHGSVKTFMCTVNSRPQREKGLVFDARAISNDVVRYASGYANQRLVNNVLDESAAMVDWLEETFKDDGLVCYSESDIGEGTHSNFDLWPVQTGYIINYSPEIQAMLDAIDSPDPAAKKMAAPGIANFSVAHAEADGARLMYNYALVQLIQDEDGCVTGAIAQSTEDGGYVKIEASKGVLLATGGYESDPMLLKHLNPSGAMLGGVPMTQPGCVGDGIRAGIWAGGAKDMNPTLMTFSRSVLPIDGEPGFPYQGMTCWIGDQPFLKVNTKGVRFCNETSPYDWPLHAATLQPGHKVCSIWDANFEQHICQFHTMGCSRIDLSPDIPDMEGLGFFPLGMQMAEPTAAGYIVSADTIEGLAEKLGMEPAVLVETVNRYNEMCAAGVDADFGKPAKDLIALDTPPFSAAYFAGHVLCTCDGLQVDENSQVINAKNQEPIPGLYATGNCAGSIFSVTYPELYWGIAIGKNLTMALHVANLIAGK